MLFVSSVQCLLITASSEVAVPEDACRVVCRGLPNRTDPREDSIEAAGFACKLLSAYVF